ncbi:MAG: nucleotide pyrophosphatase [Deltaproteobacteria bacterium]|nr:MAG: nucleotide pyrophosphatase [Deltaproteobacteria bacterium]
MVETKQRVVVALMDGMGMDYFTKSPMPVLRRMSCEGFYRAVRAVVPTVTNVNNVSVCCGAWPDEHGISSNSYFDSASGRAEYMNSADLIRTGTLFQRARRHGVRGALLSSKRKTVELFHKDTEIAISAEVPPSECVARYGVPPDIYSGEINAWLWRVAIDLLRTRPDLGVLYIHTTDYPMHRWAPEEEGSKEHLSQIDALIGEAREAAPDAAFLITADHGMNAKRRCWDLARVCSERGVPVRFALSPERDYYIRHHRNFAGSAWVWVNRPADLQPVRDVCRDLAGVDRVLNREGAVRQFRLPGEYIGDLMVLGDRETVFGDLERTGEELPATFRAHGSLHEADVPLIIHGWEGELPPQETFSHNLHLTRFLFREP